MLEAVQQRMRHRVPGWQVANTAGSGHCRAAQRRASATKASRGIESVSSLDCSNWRPRFHVDINKKRRRDRPPAGNQPPPSVNWRTLALKNARSISRKAPKSAVPRENAPFPPSTGRPRTRGWSWPPSFRSPQCHTPRPGLSTTRNRDERDDSQEERPIDSGQVDLAHLPAGRVLDRHARL